MDDHAEVSFEVVRRMLAMGIGRFNQPVLPLQESAMSTSSRGLSLAAAIALAVSSAVAHAQTDHAAVQATTTTAFTDAPAPAGGLALLFNQTGSAALQGILAMTNLDAGQEAFDTELADDFNVPAGGWAIAVVRLGTFYHSGGTPVRPSANGNVTFYYNSAAGRPGLVIPGCAFMNVPLAYNEFYQTSVLTLPQVCALPQGRHWMGFSGNLSYADQEGGVYVTQETTSASGVIAWRNPGGGYGPNCLTWGAPTSCGLDWNGDMTFQLYGQTTPVTLQKFSVE